jgi:hypothetical protein
VLSYLNKFIKNMNLFKIIFLILIARALNKFICNKCKKEVVDLQNIFDKETAAAISKSKKFYKGKQILLNKFKNPQDLFFEVFTASKTKLTCDTKIYDQTSFFHGYGWSVCYCPYCMTHHGWKFTPIGYYCDIEIEDRMDCRSRTEFYGVIIDELTFNETEKVVYEDKVEL